MRTIPTFIIALVLSSLTRAETPHPAIAHAIQPFIDKSEIAGAVTLVVSKDKILYHEAQGLADIDTKTPMKRDSIFWIASMTKPITGVCLMMLVDEGKLSLDDALSKHLPEFKDLKDKDGKPVSITLRQMMTHTSGLAEVPGPEARECKTLAELAPLIAKKPLLFAPGSKWQYCQSSINMSARVVEVISGKTFDAFLEERLTKPLGMNDTTFYPSADQIKRVATSYKSENGKFTVAQNFILLGKGLASRDRYPAANGGLYSTAADYARFCQMLLNNGVLDGKTYLKPESVKTFSTIHTGDLKTGFTTGNGWGIGACVIKEPQGVTAVLSPGSYGHGGAYGTQAWIDPAKNVAYILMVQRSNFPNADNSDVRKAFQEGAAAAGFAR